MDKAASSAIFLEDTAQERSSLHVACCECSGILQVLFLGASVTCSKLHQGCRRISRGRGRGSGSVGVEGGVEAVEKDEAVEKEQDAEEEGVVGRRRL